MKERTDMEVNKIICGDCLIEHEKIKSGSVDLILTDLPYGTVENIANSDTVIHGMQGKTSWDVVIDTNKIMQIANRILRKNGKMVLFAQQPFTTELINKAIANVPFNYSMIWEKDHFANSLTAKKAPLNYYEDILIFSKSEDTEWEHPLRNYAIQIIDFINLPKKEIFDKIGKGQIRFFRVKQDEFGQPTKTIYKQIIDLFSIDKMQGFKTYEEIKRIDKEYKKKFASTFNLWEGKKYKSNILEYKKDYDGFHPTQKPILLLEDLIKTFSNEGDLVVDLTAGSGSTAVACINTKRNYIIIEKELKYVEIARRRIKVIPELLF